jgi:hypothetical protein
MSQSSFLLCAMWLIFHPPRKLSGANQSLGNYQHHPHDQFGRVCVCVLLCMFLLFGGWFGLGAGEWMMEMVLIR